MSKYLKIFVTLVILLLSVDARAVGTPANRRVEIPQAGLAFILPAPWDGQFAPVRPGQPAMTPTDPLLLVMKRQPVAAPSGPSAIPGLNVAVFRLDQDVDIGAMAESTLRRRGYAITERLQARDIGIAGAVGAIATFEPQPGIKLVVVDLFAIRQHVVTEVVLSATASTFDLISPELRGIIRDLHTMDVSSIPAKPVSSSTFAWKAGDQPPRILGVALGETKEHLIQLLGAPLSVSPMGAPEDHVEMLDYSSRGAIVLVSRADGVSLIRLLRPGITLDGFQVGDPAAPLLAKWGRPDAVNGSMNLYNAGQWTVVVRLDPTQSHVEELQLGWNQTKFANDLKAADPASVKYYRQK